LNGIGIEIALKSHEEVSKVCEPIYCINSQMILQASNLLGIEVPSDFTTSHVDGSFDIKVGEVDASSGKYSYDSFMNAIKVCEDKKTDALVTMPIHKEAWKLSGLDFVGHTDLLRKHFQKDAIMMLGCEKMYVALYTEHIPLKDVPATIEAEKLAKFLVDFHKSIGHEKVGVLGLNPHAGDNGVLGDEEKEIHRAIEIVNALIGEELFTGTLVPDIAFTPYVR
ncbi:4-hydroxythreonine-4-phosphate dehydrogenase PdxA, partial [Sulfurovum sp.]|uniref:4-hydroxythreonine-4-phosphate dehydrogenase PdxA n=1 Tax=Sulfurovum sp. TaxID=1969726 RepID=UPI002867D963